HPGANHFYIHAVEAVDPQRAVTAAERLAGLMPGAGHLVHMPGHIYVRVGRYRDAIAANEHAVHADETYIRDQNPAFGIYVAGYYPHNYDFLAFAASMIGRREQALGAASRIIELQQEELLGAPGMTFMQHHRTRRLQMLVRFGAWEELLAEPAPPAELKHARAMWHYAHGRAAAATGELAAAEADLRAVRAAAADPALVDERLEFNTAGDILKVAGDVLAGQIAFARHDYESAVSHLSRAAEAESALTYGEPPDWSIPAPGAWRRAACGRQAGRGAEGVRGRPRVLPGERLVAARTRACAARAGAHGRGRPGRGPLHARMGGRPDRDGEPLAGTTAARRKTGPASEDAGPSRVCAVTPPRVRSASVSSVAPPRAPCARARPPRVVGCRHGR